MLRLTLRLVAFGLLASVNPAAAFFKVPCSTPLLVERADPIVSPGEVASHVHTIMGGSGFGFDMTHDSTQASDCNSCSVVEDKSNYWVASLYYHAQNGSFIEVPQNGGALIYYLQRSDPTTDGEVVAFPEGFRMLAGNPLLRSDKGDISSAAKNFVCLDYNGSGTPQTKHFPKYNCPNGVRAQVFFPSCWDGVNLDSPDHQSHVAYPTGSYDSGPCPEGFPVRLVSIFYEVIWHTEKFEDMWYGDKQPFVFSSGDPTGYGQHADFINGWDVKKLQEAIDTCDDKDGDVTKCTTLSLQADKVTDGCILERSIHEEVGPVLETLPGCNPVQPGPENAEQVTDCGATTEIGKPIHYYTDMTESGWEWIGCMPDNQGGKRVLNGANTGEENLTVESCLRFCGDEGFSIAGLENSNECFCGDSLTDGLKPTAMPMGKCLSPCAGDSSENCGGFGYIGLYKECASSCSNLEYPRTSR